MKCKNVYTAPKHKFCRKGYDNLEIDWKGHFSENSIKSGFLEEIETIYSEYQSSVKQNNMCIACYQSNTINNEKRSRGQIGGKIKRMRIIVSDERRGKKIRPERSGPISNNLI